MANHIDEELRELAIPDNSVLDFFESNLENLTRVYLKDVDFEVLNRIAIVLHGTMLTETDWMAFLNKLGINDNRAITFIKFKSKYSEELPIYKALSGPLQHTKSFGEVIRVLMESERIDALHEIKTYVENLLVKESQTFSWQPEEPTAPEDIGYESYPPEKCQENFQGNFPSASSIKIANVSSPHKEKTIIKILLINAETDSKIADRLCFLLKQAGFRVKMLKDMDYLLMMNKFEVIHSILSFVDFVVPIVSEMFLKQIRAITNEDDFSSASNNRYIYQLILNEYSYNRCLNLRVRSVIVPNFNGMLLKRDVLLSWSYKLWEGVPDFIDMLVKTKQLLQNGL